MVTSQPCRSLFLTATLWAWLGLAPVLPADAATVNAARLDTQGSVPSADGVPIHFLDSGGSAPVTLVFLHCWSCDATYFEEQVKALASSYRVVRVDLAGHGASGLGRTSYTMQAFGEDVRAVVQTLKLTRVVLVGHSMGAVVALEAARILPETVVGIVALDTLHNAEEVLPKEQLDQLLAGMDKDFKGFVTTFVTSMFPKDADQALVARVAADMASAPPAVAISAFRGLFAFDEKAGLAAAGVPIVCINGTTFATSVETNRKYAPSFRLVTMAGVGHFPMLEKPAELNRALAQVLEQMVGPGTAPARRLVKEVEVAAPVAEVWRVWTTPVGAREFFAPLANIELVPGGAYELFFDPAAPPGQRGGEGCKVLAHIPLEMLAFEWNFPPKIPSLRDSGAKTWVVVQLFEAGPGKTRVRLTQLGWRQGKDWDDGFAYFDRAWGLVLSWLQQRFTSGPLDWKAR